MASSNKQALEVFASQDVCGSGADAGAGTPAQEAPEKDLIKKELIKPCRPSFAELDYWKPEDLRPEPDFLEDPRNRFESSDSSTSKDSSPESLDDSEPCTPPGKRSPKLRAGEVVFQSLACEPYETVFFDPPAEFRRAVSEPSSPNEPAEKKRQMPFLQDNFYDVWGKTSLDGLPEVENESGPLSTTDHFLIRNLDTGETRRLGEGALNKSFQGGLYLDPKRLENSGSVVTIPWSRWWTDKRLADEKLWAAAETGEMSQLLEATAMPTNGNAPANISSRSLHARTALHIAVSVGRPECVELLLDNSADVDARTDAGLTALHIACQRGHQKVAQLLLDWSSNVLAVTNDHNLPVHLAAGQGYTEISKMLLERDRSTTSKQLLTRNSLGQRPAEVSLDIKTAELFRRLELTLLGESRCISRNANTGADDYAGRTPFQGAVLLHNARADAVCRLLRKTQSTPHIDVTVSTYDDMHAEPALKKNRPRAHSKPAALSKRHAGRHQTEASPFLRLRPDRPDIEKVGPDSFVYQSRLGKGSFGEVFQVKHKGTGQVYAMKVLRKNKIVPGNLLRYTMTERNVLSYMHHPYIVSLYFAFQTAQNLVMVMQYCPGGNLQQLIEREKRLQEPVARLYTAELLLAFCYLHERQIVFRDLKPDNVVLDEYNHSVLTDFGLSKEGVRHLQGTRSFCGSVAFLAPEILQRQGHGHTVDIYGVGVLLFDMLTGLPPFYHPDRETLFTNIRHARLQVPRYVTQQAASLIQQLMMRDPSRRLGADKTSDIKEHAFFAALDFEAVFNREVPVPPLPSASRGFGAVSQLSAAADALRGRHETPLDGMPLDTRSSSNSQNVPFWTFISSHDPTTGVHMF